MGPILHYLGTAEYGPMPPVTVDKPKPRPPVVPDSFMMLTFSG